jgi:Sec-independent protein translocase protein TatA
MDLSFSEIILVLIVALFVFGPEDLARKSRQLGQWMGKLRNELANFKVMAEDALIKEKDIDVVSDIRKATLEIEQSIQENYSSDKVDKSSFESSSESDIERRIQEMSKNQNRGDGK